MNCLESPQTQGDSLSTEGEGFEPPKACTLVVFKTTAIDHSAIPPASNNNKAATPLGGSSAPGSMTAAEPIQRRSSRSVALPVGRDAPAVPGPADTRGCGAPAWPVAAPTGTRCHLNPAPCSRGTGV